jgi:hypothetical protein
LNSRIAAPLTGWSAGASHQQILSGNAMPGQQWLGFFRDDRAVFLKEGAPVERAKQYWIRGASDGVGFFLGRPTPTS